MAKKEAATDLWVHSLLEDAKIKATPQGSTVIEINNALKTASKNGSGKVGFPEYIAIVKDFLLVIENKADTSHHIKFDDKGLISLQTTDVKNHAVNGALFYGRHLAKLTSYKKIIAFGISGNEKKHRITPIYIDETEYYRELPEVESFISFSENNIDEYYIREVLKEETDTEKELTEILKDAATLHEDLRNFGNLKDIDKPLIVSGILLALREAESKNFSINDLTGDEISKDGDKIYNAIKDNLTRSKVSPEVKKDKILSQFSIFKNSVRLNEVNEVLGKTPLKHYTEFLNSKIYKSIKYSKSSEDYLGRFYGEFMSYSGGDGQSLGIVLTPKHITDLFCELIDLQHDDIVLDPCAGTAGFLIAAMHKMLGKAKNENEKKKIKQERLHGIEDQEYMFTIATTNMILRGDGKSNLINGDFLKENPSKIQLKQASVGMMNPPYSQGSKSNPNLYEISFTEHLLNSLTEGGRAIVIIPQSSVTGKTKEEKSIKSNILKKHTLEGVITLNKDTFYGVGTMPCIAIFTAHEPHPAEKECKFIDYKNDGYKVSPHIGLIETEQAKDKKQHLLDVWFDKIEADSQFCVTTTIEADDEWLHSFYYFNDTPLSHSEIEETIGNFLSFEFSMIMKGNFHLFEKKNSLKATDYKKTLNLDQKNWHEFYIKNLFSDIQRGKRLTKEKQKNGSTPYISSTSLSNGVDNFISNQDSVRSFVNCLTIANSGSVGSTFFHPYKFVASDHVTHLKDKKFDKFSYLFIASILGRLSGKYNFNREINDARISREKIMLPINSKGEPDYEYMSQYSKNIYIKKYEEYLKYIH